jgi:hypothetical protein
VSQFWQCGGLAAVPLPPMEMVDAAKACFMPWTDHDLDHERYLTQTPTTRYLPAALSAAQTDDKAACWVAPRLGR